MSKTMLASVKGYTPVIDKIVQEDGLVTAAVFGVAWRFCQMQDGVCWASQKKIGEFINMSRQTINKHLGWLVANGYLDSRKSDIGTLEYTDTGKAGLRVTISAEVDNKPSVNLLDTPCKGSIQPPVNLLDTKKVVKREEESINTSYSENKDQFSDNNSLNEEEIDDLSPSNDSKLINSNTYFNSSAPLPEPTREPCDMDGITESMGLGYGGVQKKSRLRPEVEQFAHNFADLAGVKFPRIVNPKKDYSANYVKWWKPLEDMLYEVDYDVQVATDILERTIESLIELGAPPAFPKGAINTFMNELVRGKNQTQKRPMLDPYDNPVEL